VSKLFIIGLGPGDAKYLTEEARHCLQSCTHIVGYHLYIELVDASIRPKNIVHFELGEEVERARHALELAAQGHQVALVSSGDPGIYAMATVVFQLLDQEQNDLWQSIDIEVVCGISAFQLASSLCGALVAHDFCLISLSDLLTPWPTIEKRVKHATDGDFVIAFYNPLSKQRDWQLKQSLEIIKAQRSGNTPVVIGKQLGRPQQRLIKTSLQDIELDMVDMLSIVMIGNSQTRQVGQHLYTPRGYINHSGAQ